jgi:hypothetical protein
MILPKIYPSKHLSTNLKRLYISCYGFEDRTLGWINLQKGKVLTEAIIVKYSPNKGENKLEEVRMGLRKIGVDFPNEWEFDISECEDIEERIKKKLGKIDFYDEIVLDISSLTKFLILIFLNSLSKYKGLLRIVYTEAKEYPPSKKQYQDLEFDPKLIQHFPTQGFGTILRAKSLSSIRMQGQPVCLIAFTSFNEQLIRHMLGTINPYRLILLNGKPPRSDLRWREVATYEIHKKLMDIYKANNPINKDTELPSFRVDTLRYHETFETIESLYNEHSNYERIIVAATGSKMQTVGLFFSKVKHSDIHIEYPTPDSYLFPGIPKGIKYVHEIEIPNFMSFLKKL